MKRKNHLRNPLCRLSRLHRNSPQVGGDVGKAALIASRPESLHGNPTHRATCCHDHQEGPQGSTSSDNARRPACDLHASAVLCTASVPDVSRDVLPRRLSHGVLPRVRKQSCGSCATRSRASLVFALLQSASCPHGRKGPGFELQHALSPPIVPFYTVFVRT